MKEIKRTIKLLSDIYNGSPWIDVNVVSVLNPINAVQAFKKLSPDRNSIWEITNHLISWRVNVLQRVTGQIIISPADNYFTPG